MLNKDPSDMLGGIFVKNAENRARFSAVLLQKIKNRKNVQNLLVIYLKL